MLWNSKRPFKKFWIFFFFSKELQFHYKMFKYKTKSTAIFKDIKAFLSNLLLNFCLNFWFSETFCLHTCGVQLSMNFCTKLLCSSETIILAHLSGLSLKDLREYSDRNSSLGSPRTVPSDISTIFRRENSNYLLHYILIVLIISSTTAILMAIGGPSKVETLV